jgi:Tol biopolymer transport system component
MAADGSAKTRLTRNPAWDGFCWNEWSPDGSRVLFDSNRTGEYAIFVMAADGRDPQPLTGWRAPEEGPAWSPDGTRVALTSKRDGNWEIYIAGFDGAAPRRLTQSAGSDYNPFWSPDGRRIAFISDRDGVNEIYLMNVDGSDQRRLTRGGIDAGRDRHRWSPDGTRIAYVGYDGAQLRTARSARQMPSDD